VRRQMRNSHRGGRAGHQKVVQDSMSSKCRGSTLLQGHGLGTSSAASCRVSGGRCPLHCVTSPDFPEASTGRQPRCLIDEESCQGQGPHWVRQDLATCAPVAMVCAGDFQASQGQAGGEPGGREGGRSRWTTTPELRHALGQLSNNRRWEVRPADRRRDAGASAG
jgi:hypothetical protein